MALRSQIIRAETKTNKQNTLAKKQYIVCFARCFEIAVAIVKKSAKKKTVIVFRSQSQEIWRFFLCIGDRSLCDEMIVLSVFNLVEKFRQFLFVDLDHHDVFFIESSLQFLNKLFDRFSVFRQRLFIDSVRS